MTDFQIILICVFLLATIIGYFVIRNVPSLLHTPLMSGINALSGIIIIGSLVALAISLKDHPLYASILGAIAVVMATINVVSGLFVTDRILKMFDKDDNNVK